MRNRHRNAIVEKKILLDHIKDNWTMLGFIFSGAAYILGYYKTSCFLQKFNVFITPIDIYPVLSIFVSGMTTLITGLVIPTVCIFIGWFLSQFLSTNINTIIQNLKGMFVISIVSLFFVCFLFFIAALPGSIYVIPFLFSLLGREAAVEGWILIVSIAILIGVSCFVIKRRKKIWMIGLSILVFLWLGLFVHAQIATFPATAKDIPIGVTQQSGIRGTISTELPIAKQSKKKDSTTDCKTHYDTHGFFLSKHEDLYYFIPLGEENQGNCEYDVSLCIIYSDKVLAFYGDK